MLYITSSYMLYTKLKHKDTDRIVNTKLKEADVTKLI